MPPASPRGAALCCPATSLPQTFLFAGSCLRSGAPSVSTSWILLAVPETCWARSTTSTGGCRSRSLACCTCGACHGTVFRLLLVLRLLLLWDPRTVLFQLSGFYSMRNDQRALRACKLGPLGVNCGQAVYQPYLNPLNIPCELP